MKYYKVIRQGKEIYRVGFPETLEEKNILIKNTSVGYNEYLSYSLIDPYLESFLTLQPNDEIEEYFFSEKVWLPHLSNDKYKEDLNKALNLLNYSVIKPENNSSLKQSSLTRNQLILLLGISILLLAAFVSLTFLTAGGALAIIFPGLLATSLLSTGFGIASGFTLWFTIMVAKKIALKKDITNSSNHYQRVAEILNKTTDDDDAVPKVITKTAYLTSTQKPDSSVTASPLYQTFQKEFENLKKKEEDVDTEIKRLIEIKDRPASIAYRNEQIKLLIKDYKKLCLTYHPDKLDPSEQNVGQIIFVKLKEQINAMEVRWTLTNYNLDSSWMPDDLQESYKDLIHQLEDMESRVENIEKNQAERSVQFTDINKRLDALEKNSSIFSPHTPVSEEEPKIPHEEEKKNINNS